jgi:hypothetical protein
MIPIGTSWETYFPRIAKAGVLVVLLTAAFFSINPLLNELAFPSRKILFTWRNISDDLGQIS